jgi:SagB-type dehydrogenase family enzyme
VPPRRSRLTSAANDRYRRSPALVVSWSSSGPTCFDCRTSRRVHVSGDVLAALCELSEWVSAEDLAQQHTELGTVADVRLMLEAFAERGLVQKEPVDEQPWTWRHWTPAAAFFHFSTRDGQYGESPAKHDRRLRDKAKLDPPPPPTKRVEGPRVSLPVASVDAPLESTLLARRTWRSFGSGAVAIQSLATLLQRTWGVQHRAHVPGQGPIVLKTSPSGGARHSIEAYVIARRVAGLERGVYHYDAASHELVRTGAAVARDTLTQALANQDYFLPAAAIVIMTAVFERAMWRYPFSRAYRTVLAEAGHHGQTFCLLATALDLAPFCTMAFRDSDLESIIGVDGVNESAVYVVGVGTRPKRRVKNPGRIPRSARR